ncbi:hypothetical protein [Methylobacterium sp. J-070]|uniref:hypothetical protein n=1 Tax=Methylobacterium sp. J-070 TaxID=2836650 RepID=UPI001FBACAD7|nr:hypothetical protein [Methylobacterium sp. J-070]MCJ2051242.1 hypothetical protein [Methylobacterium sp. J-070]
MNAHTPVLPTRAAAHALDRARLADLRAAISRQIEADLDRVDRCLSLLDALDGDADFEPSLGSSETVGNPPLFRRCNYPEGIAVCFRGDQRPWAEGSNDDREQDDADSDETAPEWTGDGWQAFRNGGAA